MSTQPPNPAVTLLPCPFCGATPHRGKGKVTRCQLHGEPAQDFSIWCPHSCARITRPSEIGAIAAWNTRQSNPVAAGVGEGLREAVMSLSWATRPPIDWPSHAWKTLAALVGTPPEDLHARDALLLGGDAMRGEG